MQQGRPSVAILAQSEAYLVGFAPPPGGEVKLAVNGYRHRRSSST